MNDKSDAALAAILSAVKDAGTDFVTFLQAQAPEYCQQLLHLHLASQLIFMVVFIMCFIAILTVSIIKRRDIEEGWVPIVIFLAIFFVCATVTGVEAFRTYAAPKVVLVELLKSNFSR